MPPKPYLSLEKVQEKFSHIEHLELFDVGGQKIVYKGIDKSLGEIMLKFFKTNESDPRISREIEIAKKLRHTNLPKLYSADTVKFDENSDDKVVFLLEEYIDGITLREYIQNHDISIKISKKFLETMFSILIMLKEHNLVHRDIKPENIIIKEEKFYMLDFGIARVLGSESITGTSAPMGPHTLGYAPWEQINNEKSNISEKTDLFSISVICQEMLMKEHPFIISGNVGFLDAMRQTETLNIKSLEIDSVIKEELEEFLHTLMAQLPSSRPSLEMAMDWFNEFKGKMI